MNDSMLQKLHILEQKVNEIDRKGIQEEIDNLQEQIKINEKK